MPTTHICFDLDGTIINSFPTIYKCTLRTLKHVNISSIPDETVFHSMIGHHFTDIFNQLKINVADIETFINIYKTYYFDFIEDSALYPGMDNLLSELKKNNIKISLLTTKAQDQAEKILEHFDLSGFFDAVYGRRPGLGIKPDPDPLLKICAELRVSPEETMMVGDSDLDIQCGKNAGTKTCAVTYGYRTHTILKAEKPDYIVDDAGSILEIAAPLSSMKL